MTKKPLLFISHRHGDDQIANVLYDFIKQRTLGKVELFSSSRAEASTTPGSALNEDLGAKLAETRALALIYTTGNEDWSYCMYECGLATDPRTPDTRIIVFQCTQDVPRVFANVVRVDVHKQENVRNFVILLLTDKDFFPNYGEALAPDFNKDSLEIAEIAQELGVKLRAASPPQRPVPPKPDEELNSYHSITLELPIAILEEIGDKDTEDEQKYELVKKHATTVMTDRFCPQLFDMPMIQKGTPLEKLFDQWHRTNEKQPDDWMKQLIRQILQGCAWEFPRMKCATMSIKGYDNLYIPGVHKVRRMLARKCMQFDVYFLPMILPPRTETEG